LTAGLTTLALIVAFLSWRFPEAPLPIRISMVQVNNPGQPSPAASQAAAVTPPPAPAAASDTVLTACLADLFKGVPSERVSQLRPTNAQQQLGPAVNNHNSLAGQYGIELLDVNNHFIGAFRLNYDPVASQYKLEQTVDSRCQPTTSFGISSPAAGSGSPVNLPFGERTIRFEVDDWLGSLHVQASS
jgi:hypothetical protein